MVTRAGISAPSWDPGSPSGFSSTTETRVTASSAGTLRCAWGETKRCWRRVRRGVGDASESEEEEEPWPSVPLDVSSRCAGLIGAPCPSTDLSMPCTSNGAFGCTEGYTDDRDACVFCCSTRGTRSMLALQCSDSAPRLYTIYTHTPQPGVAPWLPS